MAKYDVGAFLEGLRKLRGEEEALASLLEKADRDGSASELIAKDHRRDLARIRAELEHKQGSAPAVLGLVVNEINELRCKALEVRGNIEELRDHASLGGADPKLGQFSADLQRSYRDVFNQISRRELDLAGLQEEIRRIDPHTPGGETPALARQPVLNVLDTPSSITDPLRADAARSRVLYPSTAPAPGPGAAPVRALDPTPFLPRKRVPLRPETSPGSVPRAAARGAAAASAKPAPKPAREAARVRTLERRYPYQAPVRIRVDGRAMLAQSGDISRSGMFLEGQPTLPAGTALVLGLAVHDFPLEIAGEVVYETPGVGMGVRFTSIGEVDLRYLGALIDRLRKLDAERGGSPGGGKGRERKTRPR